MRKGYMLMCCEDSIYCAYTKSDLKNKLKFSLRLPAGTYSLRSNSDFALSIAFTIGLSVYYWNTDRYALTLFSLLFLPLFVKIATFICKSIRYHFGDNNWRKAAMKHTAIHMAINAYNQKGSLPTLEEVKRAPKLLSNCTCLYQMRLLIFSLIFIALHIFFPDYVAQMEYLIIAVVSIVVAIGWKAFTWLEYFILVTPTDKEIQDVLSSLSYVIRNN